MSQCIPLRFSIQDCKQPCSAGQRVLSFLNTRQWRFCHILCVQRNSVLCYLLDLIDTIQSIVRHELGNYGFCADCDHKIGSFSLFSCPWACPVSITGDPYGTCGGFFFCCSSSSLFVRCRLTESSLRRGRCRHRGHCHRGLYAHLCQGWCCCCRQRRVRPPVWYMGLGGV